MNSMIKFWGIVCLLVFSFFSYAQDGLPLIKKYSVEDYHAGIENWDAIEDNHGVLYFANSEGVLEYDGVHWRLIRTTTGNGVRSLTKDVDGTIYVGGDYDFGYLNADVNGQKKFVSLADQCPQEVRSHLKHVWKVFTFQDKKIFLAEGWFIIFDSKNTFIKVLKEDVYLRSVFVINNTVYAYSNSKGILALNPKTVEFKIFHTNSTLLNRSIEYISAHPGGGIRYHLFNEGFYHLYKGQATLEKKTTSCTLDTDYIFCQSTKEDDCILGTTISGLYVVDKRSLHTKYHFDKSLGLNDNKVFAVYSDHCKNIWVCHENGLSYIALNTPVRFFNERINIKGEGLCFEKFNGSEFIGTTHGLFFSKEGPHEGFFHFELFQTLRQPIFFLEKRESKLLIGTLHGLYEYDGIQLTQLSVSSFNKSIHPYPIGLNYYLVSTNEGFQLLQFKNGFKVLHTILGINEEVSNFEIDLHGNIWLIDSENKLHRGSLNKTLDSLFISPPITIEGNEELKYLSLTIFNGDIVVGTDNGLYRYEGKTNTLHKTSKGIDDASIHLLFNQNNSNLWLQESNFIHGSLDYNVEVLSESFANKSGAKNLNSSIYGNKVFSLDNYNDTMLAIGVSDGFLQYNLNYKTDTISKAETYIRSVCFKDEKDTVLVEGLWNGAENKFLSKLQGEVTTVEFNCAANYYSSAKVLYSYKLEGVDENWSAWTVENKMKYTIQGHGSFVFKVRTSSDYANITEETVYAFTISKPWYQTYWWYTTEILTLICLMSLSVYFNRNGSSHVSRISAVIIVLTILTIFEIMAELLQDWMDAQGATIFAMKIAINIAIALSINPIESWLKNKLIKRPISK